MCVMLWAVWCVGAWIRAELAEWTLDLVAWCLSTDLRFGKQTTDVSYYRAYGFVQFTPVCIGDVIVIHCFLVYSL